MRILSKYAAMMCALKNACPTKGYGNKTEEKEKIRLKDEMNI